MSWVPGMFWLVLFVLFVLAEAATVNLVSVWFAAGALAGTLSSFFLHSIWLQAAVFLGVSAVSLFLVRPLARKLIAPRKTCTNADRLIGQEAVVTEDISGPIATGAVRAGGLIWSASSESDISIPAGETVTVRRIEGVRLVVVPRL